MNDDIIAFVNASRDIDFRRLEEIEETIDEIIKQNCTDINIICHTFARMLDLVFINVKDLKKTYYKLLNYARKVDKKIADDYDRYFIGLEKREKLILGE